MPCNALKMFELEGWGLLQLVLQLGESPRLLARHLTASVVVFHRPFAVMLKVEKAAAAEVWGAHPVRNIQRARMFTMCEVSVPPSASARPSTSARPARPSASARTACAARRVWCSVRAQARHGVRSGPARAGE